MNVSHHVISGNLPHQSERRESLELYKNLLQPHFLFNSLNNLYALSIRKSDQTPEAIAGLSQLLERVVVFSRKDRILLSEEIGLIRDYVALERIWLGECSFVLDFQVKGDPSDVTIPPLTIYTLIENAFKHGIRRGGCRGWIAIYLSVKQDKLSLSIRNSQHEAFSEADPTASQTGLGMAAVRKLLDVSYRKRYYLDARPIGDVYAVDLIIGHPAA